MLRYKDFPLIAAAAIVLYFGILTGQGLGTYFAPDDFQNMFRCWDPGVAKVAAANVLFATPLYRPLAAVFYLPLLHWFGFDPLPYRIVYWLLAWVDLWLLYALARRITSGRAAAAFAVLAGCYHAEAGTVYLSTAMIYEILCFAFMIGCLLWYVRVRRQGRALNGRALAIFVVLFICALDAKEMAVVLPAILVVYELLWHGWRRRTAAEVIPIVIAGVMSAAYTVGKMSGTDSLATLPDYAPVYTLDQFLRTTRAYTGFVLMNGEPLSTAGALAFWTVLFALAVLYRSRAMAFGAAFAFLAFLPLNFVPPRQAFVLFIPLAGLGIFAGELISASIGFVAGRLRWSGDLHAQATALVFVACFAAAAALNGPAAIADADRVRSAQRDHWKLLQEIARVKPTAKPGGKLLLVDSPLAAEWDLYFIAKMYFRDHGLKVAWVRPGSVVTGDFHGQPDTIWRFDDGKLIQVRP